MQILFFLSTSHKLGKKNSEATNEIIFYKDFKIFKYQSKFDQKPEVNKEIGFIVLVDLDIKLVYFEKNIGFEQTDTL